MLSFRDTELRSSAGSLTHVSHSGRRTPRRRLAAYPAVNSPDDRWQHDERLLERRWISSRKVSHIVTVAKAGQSGLRKRLGMDLAELRAAAKLTLLRRQVRRASSWPGLAFREAGAQSLVEGHGGVAQGRPLRTTLQGHRPGHRDGQASMKGRPLRGDEGWPRCAPTTPAGRARS
jgi:hypothetical protein